MMPLQLTAVDALIVVLSILAAFAAGFVVMRRRRSDAAYLDMALAGRKLTLPLFVATLVATWYGSVLSVGEFVHSYGIVVVLCFGVPYYIAAIVYALWIAPRIRASASRSIPEHIAHTYGRTTGRLAAWLVFILSSPAPYVLMAGELVDALTGWGRVPSMALVTIVSMAYVVRGGLRSDVAANVVQVVLMYAGYGLLLFFAMASFGGFGVLQQQAEASTFDVPGRLGWLGVLSWWIIALQTFVDPNFHQRASAVRAPSVAKRGMLVSVVCWMVFDLLTISTALYAVTFLSMDRGLSAHLYLAQAVLPPVAKGIFVGGVFAAILSTLDGYALVNGMTLGHDIIDDLRGRKASAASLRAGIIVTGIMAILIAAAIPNVIDIFFTLAAVTLPGLLTPLLFSYTRYAALLVDGSALRIIIPPAIVGLALVALPGIDLVACMLTGIVFSIGWHLYIIMTRGRA
jgi:solute:Na+ symporter, SSS family